MIMNKKAQGLTLNTMAVAVIVLVVILVTLAIFSGFVGDKVPSFLSEQTECKNQPGAEEAQCKTSADCETGKGVGIKGLGCPSGEVCCIER